MKTGLNLGACSNVKGVSFASRQVWRFPGLAILVGLIMSLSGCASSNGGYQSTLKATTEQPTATSSTSPSFCYSKGQAAEQAGDLVAASHWYMLGAYGTYYGNVTPGGPSVDNTNYQKATPPEDEYYFKCLLQLARVSARRYTEYGDNADNGNREIINANVSSMAYANAEYMLSQHCTVDSSGNFVGTYWGVSYAGLEAEDHQSDNNSQVETQRLQAEHDARMADQENTMNAISQGAQSAATAFSGRAPSVVTPAASSTAAYNSPNAGQAAIQACSQNNAYLHWQGLCQTANAGNNQGPCYCAAAALLRCYIQAAPNDPNVGNWKQDYQQNIQNAQAVGMKCFNN